MSPQLFRLALSVLLFHFATATAFADKAPALNLPTANGNVSLDKYNGKVVLLDFWASWCAPCQKSFPWMNSLQKRYQDEGLVIIAVNLDKENAKAQQFLTQHAANFIVAYDPDGKTAEAFNVRGMPSSYIIDRTGELRASHIGFRESDTNALESKIRSILTQ